MHGLLVSLVTYIGAAVNVVSNLRWILDMLVRVLVLDPILLLYAPSFPSSSSMFRYDAALFLMMAGWCDDVWMIWCKKGVTKENEHDGSGRTEKGQIQAFCGGYQG